ncbi:MAG: hypothetical protein ACFCUM_08770 [Bacteroidales bacterium]
MTKKLYWSVGLLSASIIAFQLTLMQLLSIIQWSHFAYMVISVALLGFGASGTLLAITRNWFIKRIAGLLPVLMMLTGASMSLIMIISSTVFGSFDSYLLFMDGRHIQTLLATYFAFLIPFFFGALTIGLIYINYVERIGSLYFADLFGSGIGGLALIGLLWIFFPADIPAVISFLPIIAGLFIIPPSSIGRYILPVILAVTMPVILLFYTPDLPMSQYKALSTTLNLPEASVVMEKSSPYGHIHVVSSPVLRYAPGLSLAYTGNVPVRDVIFNNGNWFGPVVEWSSADTAHFMDYTTNSLPFEINSPDNVLILDAGTGLFASHALTRGVRKVTAVEQNRIAVNLMKNELAHMMDSMYHLPRLSSVSLHSRSYLMSADTPYDLIVLPTIESFGGTSGINALEQQYIFTLQALDEIWNRLTENGMIAVTVWMDFPSRNPLKLLATLVDTHEKNSNLPVENHLAAIRGWGTVTFVLKKKPLVEGELVKIRDFCEKMFFDPVILPGLLPDERKMYNQLQDDDFFNLVDKLMTGDREALFREYDFNIQPSTDDRPYFSQYLKLRRYSKMQEIFGRSSVPFFEIGYMVVLITFIQITAAALILILLPLFVLGWKGGGKLYTVLHFSGIGLGFMFLEIILIQQFILYFGNPIYAAATVLSGMLICSGAGSLISSRLKTDRRSVVKVIALIIFFIFIYVLFLVPLLRLTIDQSLMLKILLSIIFICPAAFFMGMPFPLGLRLLSKRNNTLIPWAWGINGCLSVISTALATIIAVEAGYLWVMLIAAFSYLLTLFANLKLP